MDKNRGNLIRRAIFSRLLVIVVQFLANSLVPDHDANVFIYPKEENANKTVLDKATDTVIGGFVRWDAQYFMHLAINGYTYENTLAFFPLLPMICKILVNFLSYCTFDLFSIDSLTLVIYVVLNVLFFVEATLALYKLTGLISNERNAYKCAKLFCYNPASVFFTAPYTESLFACLTFKAIENMLVFYYKNDRKYLMKATAFVALSSVTRSNGVLNVGFIGYYFLVKTERVSAKALLTLTLTISVSLLPFTIIQFYHHSLFCTSFEPTLPEHVLLYGELNGMVLPGQSEIHRQSWCNYQVLPMPYSYVQDIYWNVGFLKYYKLKQAPNFLLALPIIWLVLRQSYRFFRNNWKYLANYSMLNKVALNTLGLSWRSKTDVKSRFEVDFAFPCILHALALTIFCILFVHIQVTTRMLCSATPAIYWFSHQVNRKMIKYYYLSYFYVGTILFCNFFPWT